jgi:hypothetical protein
MATTTLAENDATPQPACIAFNFANLFRGELEASSDPRPNPPANQADGMGLERFQELFLNAAGVLERRGRCLVFKLSRGLGACRPALWTRFEKRRPSSRKVSGRLFRRRFLALLQVWVELTKNNPLK